MGRGLRARRGGEAPQNRRVKRVVRGDGRAVVAVVVAHGEMRRWRRVEAYDDGLGRRRRAVLDREEALVSLTREVQRRV